MATDTMAARPQDRSYLAEVGDFLFATDTIAKIAKGEGTWGDAALVGVTAASFFIPPAKIAMLSSKALTAVIKASSKVAASETASAAAKRAAAKTLDDALTMKRQGYIPEKPTQRFGGEFDQPVERVGRAGMGEPTPAYQVGQSILKRGPKESDAAYAKRVKDYEEGIPTPAAKAEKGMVEKKYSRTSDEDYNYYDRDIDAAQAAEDAIASSRMSYKEAPPLGTPKGSAEELTTKYVANPKRTKEQISRAKLDDARKASMYDKTKFTQDEIDDRIAGLSKKELNSPGLKRKPGESKEDYRDRLEEYVRGGDIEDLTPVPFATIAMRKTGEYTDDEIEKAVDTFRRYVREPDIEKDAKEVTYLYLAARRMLKDIKLNSKLVPEDRRISPADLKVIKESFGKLKKEFKEKVVDTAEGKALLKKIEKEMPAEPKSKDVLLRYEENLMDDAKPGELKAFIDEAVNDTPITTTAKGSTRTGKVPVKIRVEIPKDLLDGVTSDIERTAALLAERSKLNAFNAKNATKLKTETNQKEISKLKQSGARNKKIIDRINDELREMRMLSREDKIKAQEIADEVTRRNLAKRKVKSEETNLSEAFSDKPTKLNRSSVVPGKGGETAKLTRQGKIAKARAEVERLRKQWSDTPAADTEARSRIAQEAKKFADYIEKLEGK
jgi:hypothetical protein